MSTAASPSPTSTPTILSFSRAYAFAAKRKKLAYWGTEILATLLAIGASVAPWARVAAAIGVLSVVAKVASKLVLSEVKRLSRTGERQRRYDFYMRTLGWPSPASERADMSIANASKRIKKSATKLAPREPDYYAHQGPPSSERLFCNLAESMFWTERLFNAMAKIRQKHLAFAVAAVFAVLIGSLVIEPAGQGLLVLKYLGTVVALLVALDVLGEARAFGRGGMEVGKLLSALATEMARPTPSRDEALRLLIEYNCLLADLPMLPDSVYNDHHKILLDAWKEYETSLPFRCTTAA